MWKIESIYKDKADSWSIINQLSKFGILINVMIDRVFLVLKIASEIKLKHSLKKFLVISLSK